MTKEELIHRGHEAKAMIESDIFKLVMDTVRCDAYRDFSSSLPCEGGKREEAYHLLRAIEAINTNLKALADSARLEERKINNA